MNSSTATGGRAPRKALAVRAVKRSAPKCGGVKQQKAVRTAITTAGADNNTRAGKRKRNTAVASARKSTIDSIMSGSVESSSAGAADKSQVCRKRKAGRKAITAASSSSSSSSSEEHDESGSDEEADIRDATDPVHVETKSAVVSSSVKDTDSDSE